MYISAPRVKTARRHPPAESATTTDPKMVPEIESLLRQAIRKAR